MPRTAQEQTVFVLAPTGRDARLISDMLSQADVRVEVCPTSQDLFTALESGAAAAIVAEEGLSKSALHDLRRLLHEQPFWSDLPIIFLTFAGRPSQFNVASAQLAGELGNVTLLERPVRPETLRLAVRAAIRARTRQYQLRTRQENLQQAISELEQFAYSASHDLREPLRNISIFSELLETEYKDSLDEMGREYCQFVRTGAKRMEGLVEDLLSYTKLGDDGDREETCSSDASKCLQMALASLKQTIEENSAIIQAEELPTVAMKSTHLYQIFQNLIGNAIKYRRKETPRVQIRASHDAGFGWKFAVQDNGIGIRPEYQERIFGLFKRLHNTTQYTGSGIGLAICQRIVQRYGGRIWVESEPGEGSTFYFSVKG